MRPTHFIEVMKDDGNRARLHADSVELVIENPDGLTIATTRVTLKVVDDTMESFWEKLKSARGGIESLVICNNVVPTAIRARVPKPKLTKPQNPTKKTTAA